MDPTTASREVREAYSEGVVDGLNLAAARHRRDHSDCTPPQQPDHTGWAEPRCADTLRLFDKTERPCGLRADHPGAHQHSAGVTWGDGGLVPADI